MKPGFFIFIIASLNLLLSCKEKLKSIPLKTSEANRVDTFAGNSPFITKNSSGSLVLSWARLYNDSSAALCFVVIDKDEEKAGKIVTVPGSENMQPHSENLPKIIFKPTGEIIALWGASNRRAQNKYAGLVYYSQSFDKGKNWTGARPLVADTTGFDQRYYDVALLPSGEVAIIWLDNRRSGGLEGSALYYASTSGTHGFQQERKIAEGCCPCCRTDLYVDSKAGVHVLYRGILKDSIRDMLHSVSNDGGLTFSEPRLISMDNWVINGCPHTGPAMTENKKGLHFAWYTGAGKKGCFYTRSSDNGRHFSPSEQISGKGSHPQMTSLSSGELLIAWDEYFNTPGKTIRGIAIERRTAEGVSKERNIVTPGTIDASYPVITSKDDKTAIVAYTVKDGQRTYVMYQEVR